MTSLLDYYTYLSLDILHTGPSSHTSRIMPLKPVPSLIGVCVRAGTMDKAVKVRTTKQKLDNFLQKVCATAHTPSFYLTSSQSLLALRHNLPTDLLPRPSESTPHT